MKLGSWLSKDLPGASEYLKSSSTLDHQEYDIASTNMSSKPSLKETANTPVKENVPSNSNVAKEKTIKANIKNQSYDFSVRQGMSQDHFR